MSASGLSVAGKVRLEKFAMLLRTMENQQECNNFIKDMDELLEKHSKSSLAEALPPSVVITQKGRPKNTRRSKLAVEYQDEEINRERKEDDVE